MDPKQKAIEELMGYLDKKDGEELGAALKPKEDPAVEVEIESAEGMEPEGAEAVSVAAEGESQMSPEEMEELIEAIQSKLGA